MGFPTRPSRLAFGPLAYKNRFAVQEPDKEIGEDVFNLLFWQTAGLGVAALQAYAAIDFDGADVATLVASAEAWDAEGGIVPVLSQVGVGHLRLTYAVNYPDENGVSITTNFLDALPKVQSTAGFNVLFFAQSEVLASKREVDIFIRNTAFALDDPTSQRVAVWIF